jgi:hypothetical protein
VGTFVNGLPSGDAVRIMASGAKYSGGFSEGLYSGRGSALFFDGSHYEGEWDSGLRSRWGRWIHADASQVAPEVLGKVFDAVKAVIGGDEVQKTAQQNDGSSPVSGSDYFGTHTNTVTNDNDSLPPPPPAATHSSVLPPPDVLSNPIPGKIGGDGALDAGRAGNPSGPPPPLLFCCFPLRVCALQQPSAFCHSSCFSVYSLCDVPRLLAGQSAWPSPVSRGCVEQ